MKLILLFLYVGLFFNQCFANTILVTGANSGIGFALVNKYLEEGYNVIATYRNQKRSEDLLKIKNPNLSLIKVDLMNHKAPQIIKKAVENKPIDILFNNACFTLNSVSDPNKGLNTEDWLDQFLVCSVQPIQITIALKDNLKNSKEKKVIMIGSRISSVSLNANKEQPLNSQFSSYGYKTTKASLHASSVILAKELIKDDIILTIIHPGMVRTKIVTSNKNILTKSIIEPEESANKIFELVENITASDYMTFINNDKTIIPF